MRILFSITRADTIGGAQVHIRDLAQALLIRGHEVLVVTGASGPLNTSLKSLGIQTVACNSLHKSINPMKDRQALSFLIKTIQQFKPNLVTTHSSKAGILGRIACKITKTPCIFTAHGWAFTEGVPQPSRAIYQLLERLGEPLADKIICVSECDRSLGIQTGMNPSRLVTIHNGIEDIPEPLRTKPDTTSPIRITMVARFDRQKDHLTLIEAFKNIQGAELVLIGDGPRLEEIKTYVSQIGIAEKVNFLGYRDNISEILAQSHIFALISNWEGFPYTVVEALRAGLPVVASNVGGVTEAIIDGVTGYCVPRGDIDLLRQRLLKLVNDGELREKMGRKGRERYESEFTFKHMFEKTFTVYEEVLKQKTK
jgi:glycosyltransferase involved in cell wall biosynthesis